MKIIKAYQSLSKESRKVVMTFLAFLCSIIWSLIKLFLGIYESSGFLIASSIFTMCLAISKLFCLIGITKHQTNYVFLIHIMSSVLIIIGGIFYGFYNTRLLFGESTTNYGLIPSITIATVSFFLFIKSIVYLFKDKKHNVYHRNLRVIAFIGGLMDIVLTQFALLAVQLPDMDQKYNLYMALGVAVITIILGIYCLLHSYKKS